MSAFDAFDNGFGSEHGFVFGCSEHDAFPSPATLHNTKYLIERFTANNRDLGDDSAVLDTVAMYLAGVLGTPIGDVLNTTDSNDVTAQKQAPDPATKRPRDCSVLGAAACGIDSRAMVLHAVGRQLRDLCDDILGRRDGSDASEVVKEHLQVHGLTDNARDLVQQLRQAVAANVDTYVNCLYSRSTPAGRQYFANREFVPRLNEVRQQLRIKHLPNVTRHLVELVAVVSTKCEADLRRLSHQVLIEHGLHFANSFAAMLHAELERLETQFNDDNAKSMASAISLIGGWWWKQNCSRACCEAG